MSYDCVLFEVRDDIMIVFVSDDVIIPVYLDRTKPSVPFETQLFNAEIAFGYIEEEVVEFDVYMVKVVVDHMLGSVAVVCLGLLEVSDVYNHTVLSTRYSDGITADCEVKIEITCKYELEYQLAQSNVYDAETID